MEKVEIFNYAKNDYDYSLNDIKDTTFRVIENILRSICSMDINENEKRKKVIEIFSKIKGSHERKIMGVKRDELVNVINKIFSVNLNGFSNPNLSGMQMNEIIYYYCVTERIIKSKIDFTYERELEKIKAEQERMKAEEEKKKVEMERKRKDEEMAVMLNQMSDIDRKIHIIKQENNEEKAGELLRNIDAFNPEDKLKAANTLKEFWIKNSKWEGNGLSKKQKPKVEKVKGILGANK